MARLCDAGRRAARDRARVTVDGAVVGAIGPGLVALVGVTHDDDVCARRLAAKLWHLRVLDDEARRDEPFRGRHRRRGAGRRPVHPLRGHGEGAAATGRAAPPEQAEPLVDAVVAELRALGARVATGRFRADIASPS